MNVDEQWSVASTALNAYESGFVRGVLYHRHGHDGATVEQFLGALQLYEVYRQFCRAYDVDPAQQEDPEETEGLSYAEVGFRDALVFVRYGIVHAAEDGGVATDADGFLIEGSGPKLH